MTKMNDASKHSYNIGGVTINVKSYFNEDKPLEEIMYSLVNVKLFGEEHSNSSEAMLYSA